MHLANAQTLDLLQELCEGDNHVSLYGKLWLLAKVTQILLLYVS
jgi:hypothetical protein